MRFRALSVALLAGVLSASGLAATPPGTPTRPAPVPALAVPYTQFTLANGLHVILHEDHRVPMIATDIWYHVGSDREQPGRTGFAHLFEHLMFMGSGHVKLGQFDNLLERTGGDNNASTSTDRTNYWITAPSNALELALYLEADRMGYLLDAMSPRTVDAQRDVVKNERRQSYENRPYGMAEIELPALLYPPDHPYHWPTIGNMADLSAASYDDVVAFFKRYYSPNNAVLAIAGDIDPAAARRLVDQWFGGIPRGAHVPPIAPPAAELTGVVRKTLTDRVELPRLYLAWLTPPQFHPGDAALDVVSGILANGKNSRLYKRLVYDLQIAQNVYAYQDSEELSSTFNIVVTPRPGHTIAEVHKVVDEELEKLREQPPTEHELQRAVNQIEASFYDGMEKIGGFGGVADLLNAYYTETGDPDYFNEDLSRYRALAPSDIQAAVRYYLPADRRVELSVVPARN
ncbi:MAG TPA: pitrilysin family protein [Vicinamibacterales bacterium]|nr:pitrilysin family protein [Vicinamibacterales bacterium]